MNTRSGAASAQYSSRSVSLSGYAGSVRPDLRWIVPSARRSTSTSGGRVSRRGCGAVNLADCRGAICSTVIPAKRPEAARAGTHLSASAGERWVPGLAIARRRRAKTRLRLARDDNRVHGYFRSTFAARFSRNALMRFFASSLPLRDRGGQGFHHKPLARSCSAMRGSTFMIAKFVHRRIAGDALRDLDPLRKPLAVARRDSARARAPGLPRRHRCVR